MIEIDFSFKDKLDQVIGGEMHSFCFQCGACVGDCPSARYSEKFNPRLIMLKTILGQYQELLTENSIIWECTNCYNCYERCPQDVRPVEVIVALKNMIAQKKQSPPKVQQMVDAVEKTGRTVIVTPTSQRIRNELGLKPVAELAMDELKEILA
ncbi:4Fe-4S dicluster domain-containing protein [candidate division KSB1 bacterium]|nr:4Fe-4S dicluster domain-containing protein [candidate division KSB1 bacterium]